MVPSLLQTSRKASEADAKWVPGPVLEPGVRQACDPWVSLSLFLEMRDRLGVLTRWATSPLSYHIRRPFSLSFVALASRKKRMPPKKAPQEKKVLLGRPSNNLKIGIVGTFPSHGFSFFIQSYCHPLGLPNVGKSSFFNTLSQTGRQHSFFSLYTYNHRLDFF